MKTTFKIMPDERPLYPPYEAPCPDVGTPVRCLCGALVARLVPGGVELRCRRCKRVHVLPLEASESAR